MCGIAGIVGAPPPGGFADRLGAAARLLVHRGPEGSGWYVSPKENAAFAHQRLCVIDPSAQSAQPMAYGGRYHIVHNGELYNYLELKAALQAKGCTFRTLSDTEVIVAAYATWGADCLQHFDGMFAFAIWDEQSQTLFAARDRFGEKPFYFFVDNDRLLFASELSALMALGAEGTLNHALLYNFLTIGYTANPLNGQETFFQHLHKLPAAHYLLYDGPKAEASLHRYWQLETEIRAGITEADAVETFSFLLRESVRLRLRSDVAIGTSLSGGLDSSAVLALCQSLPSAQFRHQSFTAVFPHFAHDESEPAKTVARHLGVQQATTTIEAGEVAALMHTVSAYQQEPFLSASALAQYKVYALAKASGVTVLLDGQGADEVLAGYHHYYKWWWQELYRQRQLKRSGERKAAQALGIPVSFGIANKAAAVLPHLAEALLQSRKSRQAWRHPSLHPDWAFAHKRSLYYSPPPTPDLRGALYHSTAVYGLEELLRLADRNSMAHAVEVRLPFLSPALVQFVFSLPSHVKIRQGWTKWILRKAVQPALPESIVWRRDKVGFEPPQKEWMQNKDVQESIQAAKEVLVNAGILHNKVLRQKVQPHNAYAAANWDWKVWSAGLFVANNRV